MSTQPTSAIRMTESNSKPRLVSLFRLSHDWKSFRSSVRMETSVLGHITNAEDIYETDLFSTDSQLRVFNPNLHWVLRILEYLHNGVIELLDGASSADSNNMGKFSISPALKQVTKPDMVVLCTGYEQTFPFLRDTKRRACHADVRGIWMHDPSIGFIGFLRPKLGAIPPLAEMQARLWVLNLLAPELLASRVFSRKDEAFYQLASLKNARMQYGVDHESYAYQLALDVDSAPSSSEFLRIGFSKRELSGPWKWQGAAEVMTGELW
ncbi:hypothetical protein F5Y19DRAFT_469516 [Xylariaceae sp. FL1651]|nr:hypothetical protein F5Y19DRAFT_469516 [Xylariaceae sp. FL1651]